MNTLQEIQTRLKEAESKYVTLMDDLDAQAQKLAERKSAQSRALLEGQDTGKIEKEIIEIQTRIPGLQSAVKAQSGTLDELRAQKQTAESQLHFEQAEQARIEAEEIQAEIHALIAEVFRKTSSLSAKDREYRSHLKQVDKKLLTFDALRIRRAIEAFKKDLVALLDAIHPAMLIDKKSPDKNGLRKLLRSDE